MDEIDENKMLDEATGDESFEMSTEGQKSDHTHKREMEVEIEDDRILNFVNAFEAVATGASSNASERENKEEGFRHDRDLSLEASAKRAKVPPKRVLRPDETIVDFNDPDVFKKLLSFARHKHFDNYLSLTYAEKDLVSLGNPDLNESNHPYATLRNYHFDLDHKNLSYAQIGKNLLAKLTTDELKQITKLALKIFRGHPCPELNDLSSNLRHNLAFLVSLMACEAGRGETGLINMVAQYRHMKHYPEGEDLQADITTKLFPEDYNNEELDATRVAPGFRHTQSMIRIASNKLQAIHAAGEQRWLIEGQDPLINNSTYKRPSNYNPNEDVSPERYNNMTIRDINRVASMANNPRNLLTHPVQNYKRKLQSHMKILYALGNTTSTKTNAQDEDPRIIQNYKDLIAEDENEQFLKKLARELDKGYLNQLTDLELVKVKSMLTSLRNNRLYNGYYAERCKDLFDDCTGKLDKLIQQKTSEPNIASPAPTVNSTVPMIDAPTTTTTSTNDTLKIEEESRGFRFN